MFKKTTTTRLPTDLAEFRGIRMMILVAALIFGGVAAAEEVADKDISNAIEAEYWFETVVDSNLIDVSTDEGVVTLEGVVDNLLAKERAAAIAATTVGVRAIVNLLEVRPDFDGTELQLEQSVRQALLDDPAADSYEIDVSADGGRVTLSGSVDSWQERELSETVAKGVFGVTEIVNDISVVHRSDRSDSEIKADVEARLANDLWVDDYLIDVEVNDGTVNLDGTVGSLAEKNQAVRDAWVVGTKGIDAEDLEIEWWARDNMRSDTAYERRSDQEIEEAVKDAFIYDPRVFAFEPEVSVDNGTVVLNGVVDSLTAKRAAEQDARNTIGVWRVRNHLKVRPLVVVTDEDIEFDVRSAFSRDPFLEKWAIDVEASHGLVVLSGRVNTSFEKLRAELVAEGVFGATQVINNIEFDHHWVWRPDREIEADIHDQLWWTPFVDANQVDVTVENGVATLTGEVETWSEWSAAAENAFEGGAKDVRNELEVSYPYYGPGYDWNTPLFPPAY